MSPQSIPTTPAQTTQVPQISNDVISTVEEAIKQSGGDAKTAFYSMAKQKGVDADAFLRNLSSMGNPMTMLQEMMASNQNIGGLLKLFSGLK